ncbi:hypothetical protein AB0K34_21765 [Actinomadura sp. NPDC049382]|uniref:PD-(D/E)XK nuclease domain-containing protein n=1 Tax=Actinomadura sp. NPDC049382 TaxID=3158220 RepID=UPI0034148FE9
MERRQRDQLTALVDEADELERLARNVQTAQGNAEALAQLELKYLPWHARCLTFLPDDLLDKFRFEYEGNFAQWRIKHFLQKALERNSLYNEETAAVGVSPWTYTFNDTFRGPLLDQKRFLLTAAERFGGDVETLNRLDLLETIFRRLPFAIAVLRREVNRQPGLPMKNEYDLQRLVHAVLSLHFLDVEPEDSSPTAAGSAPRIDFVLGDERIAFETKMTRESLTTRKLGDELAADIIRYKRHPDASAFFGLIYDPDRRIGNAAGFERSLNSDTDDFPVRVIIVQG